VPSGAGWVHEIKYDGYRLQVRRDGDAVRLFTRRGYDWSGRYPAIAVTAARLMRQVARGRGVRGCLGRQE
jgi:bifunctional non-homologous end joining protein LigD